MSSADPLDVETVEREMENRRDEWLDILTELIRIPSVNPPGDTTEIADFLVGLFDEKGIPYEVIAPKEEMPNVVADFEGDIASAERRHLVFNGHLDTFPVSGADDWDRDPFSGAVEQGKVHGLGAADMHGGFTASLASFLYLFERRSAVRGRVTFAATSDEESGSEWGVDHLLTNYPDYRGDAVINGEPSSNGMIRFGGRGTLWLTFTIRGESNHSAYPGGVNAIDEFYQLLSELRPAAQRLVDVPDTERELVVNSRNRLDSAFGEGATERVLNLQVGPNVLHGGEKVNLTAENATAETDIRMPLGTAGKDVIAVARELAADSAADIDVEVVHHTDPTHSDTDHPILQNMQECAGRVRGGDDPQFSCGLAMTDARFYRQHGVPAAVYGPTPYNVGHPNEYIHVDDFMDVVKTHAMTAATYLDI